MPLPSLDHAIEATDLQGRSYRWSAEERSSWDIPTNVSWASRRGDGYAEATFTLQRPITRDFPDLGLLNEITVTADDGTVVYQGRVSAFPRTSHPATGEFFSITANGWMAHAADRTFQEIYVDRDLTQWTGPSTARQVYLIGLNVPHQSDASVRPDDATGEPSLAQEINGAWATPFIPRIESIYNAHNIPVGSLYYALKHALDTSWEAYAHLQVDDGANPTVEFTADLIGTSPTSGTLTASGVAKYVAMLRMAYNATAAGTDGAKYVAFWTVLAVYGAHGLTKRGTASATEAQGFYASDVISNIVSRFCPLLDASDTVDATSYVIGQLAFKEPLTPYAAIQQINGFHQYELAVWEDRKFHFTQPTPLDDWDWEIRLEDPETNANLQGDSIEDVANGVVVKYSDLIDGTSRTLTPETNTALADTSESNPANLAGIDRWIEVSIPFPTLAADAEQYGRAKLGEFSRPKAPGEFSTGGYIRDRSGNWQPGSRVRAGQRVVVSDHPNDAPRRIQDTSWDDTNKTLRITTDNVSQRLEGFFSRIALGRSTAGIG